MQNNKRCFLALPLSAWLTGVAVPVLGGTLYFSATWILSATGRIALATEPKLSFLDDAVPFLPFFILFYVYSYVFWGKGYACLFLTEKKHRVNTLCAVLAGFLLYFVILLLFPTYLQRTDYGLLEAAEKPGFIPWVLRLVYYGDGGERGYNCLPSMHVLEAVYAYLCVRKRPEISKGYRIFSFVMMWVICVTVLVVKQHFILDVAAGLALAVGTYALAVWVDPAKRFFKIA